jgi:hypothetical protein
MGLCGDEVCFTSNINLIFKEHLHVNAVHASHIALSELKPNFCHKAALQILISTLSSSTSIFQPISSAIYSKKHIYNSCSFLISLCLYLPLTYFARRMDRHYLGIPRTKVTTEHGWRKQPTQHHTVPRDCMCSNKKLLMMDTVVSETCRAA